MKSLGIVAHIILAYVITCSSAADDLSHLRKRNYGRRPASYLSETAKHLSLAYSNFYHRHDSAGCMYAGLALAAVNNSSLTAEQIKAVSANLSTVKAYCTDDKTTRYDVIRLVRESVRVVNGRESTKVVEAAEQ